MFGRPVEPPSVTLDQESFRALASEVRVEILKQLDARRMTVTDLSNALSLSKSTLLEHLERLQAAALVKRIDEGRKWIYYELTAKARRVLHPERVKIIVSLATAVVLVSVGALALLAGYQGSVTPLSETSDAAFPRAQLQSVVPSASDSVFLGIGLLALAAIPLFLAFLMWRRAGQRATEPSPPAA